MKSKTEAPSEWANDLDAHSESGADQEEKKKKKMKTASPPEKPDACKNKIPSMFWSFKSPYHEKELQYFACLILKHWLIESSPSIYLCIQIAIT